MAAELAAVTAAEIYSPDPDNPTKTLQIWKTLIAFISFVSQVLLQFFRITPSLLSSVGIRQYSLISPTFKPIPSDETTPPPPTIPKLTIVLDLDETLVCAYERFCLPDVVKSHAIDVGVKCFEIECLSIEMDDEGRPKVNHVTVFERPGLREFLMKISEFADLVLFTAGLEGYARPLVDRIDVDKKFGLRLYRPSTVNAEYREHVKDLTCLSKDLCRTVIVDNNPFSFLLQPLNGIPCAPFSAAQPYDEQFELQLAKTTTCKLMAYLDFGVLELGGVPTLLNQTARSKRWKHHYLQLLDVILPLLKFLSFEKDVQLALYEKFHMPEWLQEHGIPSACINGI